MFRKKLAVLTNILDSLKNNSDGYSGRKISAADCVAAAIYIFIYKVPAEDRLYAGIALLIFALLCLGLITIPQLIEILNNKKNEKSDPEPK